MKKQIQTFSLILLACIACIILGASCAPKTIIQVNGFLFGRKYVTTVDNPLAKLIMTEPESENVTHFFASNAEKPLNTQTLSEIAFRYSMDVSTLYFLERSYRLSKNKEAQDLYLNYFDQLSNKNFKQPLLSLNEYYIVFVPGLDYLDTTNGGDFAKQRRLLSDNNIKNELILTGNWGYTDDNAKIIADRLKLLNKQYENIIIVSASKGGLDVAVALGKLLKSDDVSSVKAWVSVGGILKGSPVADQYLHWPKCWVAKIGLLFVKQKMNFVLDISYKKRKEEFENLHFPENIKRVHFVGAPLSTQIHKRIRSNYCSIREYGPNDGITPLADEVTEGGIIISELGFDHYYKHPDIDKKTIALALTVVNIKN